MMTMTHTAGTEAATTMMAASGSFDWTAFAIWLVGPSMPAIAIYAYIALIWCWDKTRKYRESRERRKRELREHRQTLDRLARITADAAAEMLRASRTGRPS